LRVTVEGDGHACHTGRRSCFYRLVPVQGASGEASQLTLAPDADDA
jgi:phosphoribosyl-AMP cyclohydrolase